MFSILINQGRGVRTAPDPFLVPNPANSMTQPETEKPLPKSDLGEGVSDASDAPEPEPEPWTPERASEWNAYYDVYVTFAALLLAFVASANVIENPSIWNQLQAGRLIAATGGPVTTDPFSYTREGQQWVNIPWLFEWGQALVYKAAFDLSPSVPADPIASTAKAEQFGAGALVALNALFRLLTLWVLLGVRRPGPGKWWAAVCAVLALAAVPGPIGLQLGGVAAPAVVGPSTWGLFFLAIELLLLDRAVAQGTKRGRFLLVPMFVLWANVDDSFLFGLLVLACTAIGRLWPSKRIVKDAPAPLGAGIAFGVFAASALACLVNPNGVEVYRAALEPLMSYFRPSTDVVTVDQLSYFGPKLKEQIGNNVYNFQLFYGIAVGLGLASFVLNRRRFDLGRFLTFVAAATLWGLLIRFRTEFALVAAATLALNGQEWFQDTFGTAGQTGSGWSFWSVGGRLVTLALLFLCVGKALLGGIPQIPGFKSSPEEARFGFGFEADAFPFEAADFLKTAPMKGNVLNTKVAQGDALVWRAFPARKDYNDSRPHLFPQSLRNQLQQLQNALRDDDKSAWQPILDRLEVSSVMIDPQSSPNTYMTLSASKNWVPFYDDGQVMLFGRADAVASDVAFFKENRLDPDAAAYKRSKPTPAADRPPTPVNWIDNLFQTRALTRPQPHNEAARRWLSMLDSGPNGMTIPDPARCLLAVREARTALAAKPDDRESFRLLAAAYRTLMTEESALLAGIALTPENVAQIGRVEPRPERLPTRFRQCAAALSYAIQTTPPPRNQAERHELQSLNMELFQLFMSVKFVDVARDRLKAAVDSMTPDDYTPEQRAQLARDLAQLNEQVVQVQNAMSEAAAEQAANPVALASFASQRGAPGLALHELEEAERTGANPALVRPRLVDLYCETGQPEKAVELFTSGTINDPTFGSEPGLPALRQARSYFLLGNDDYAATLLEKYALPALRFDRGARALGAASAFLKGEVKGATAALLDLPDKIGIQANWEFEAALYRLEGGTPELAAEHFTKALTIAPSLSLRPVAAYYLEKLGKPVPPPPETSTTKPEEPKAEETTAKPAEPQADDKPKDETKPKDKPKADDKPKDETKPKDEPKADDKPKS